MVRFTLVALGMVMLVAGAGLLAEEPGTAEGLVKQADAFFAKKTFQKAMEGYEKALGAGPTAEQAFHAKFRVAECLIGLNRQWEAVQKLESLRPETAEGSLDRARTAALLGSTRAQYWGGSRDTVAVLDEAAGIYGKLGMTPERVAALFDLARALGHGYDYGIAFEEWQKEHWRENPAEIKVTWEEWSRAKMLAADEERFGRVLATYAEIVELTKGTHEAALALFQLGAFRVNVYARAFGTGPNYYAGILGGTELTKEQAAVLDRYTREVEEGISVWRRLLAESPKDSLADDARYLVGRTRQERLNDFVAAAAEYEGLLADFPDSEWADTARSHLQEIRKADILLDVTKPFLPGANPKIGLAARNVATLRFRAWRLDLPKMMRAGYRFHEADGIDTSEMSPYAEWTVETGAGKDHRGVQKEIEVPFSAPGAFLVEADSEAASCRTIVVLSQVGMVVKSEEDGVLAYAADAATGKPMAQVRFLVKASWYTKPIWNSKYFEGVSGEDGTARIPVTGLPVSRARLEVAGTLEDHVAVSEGQTARDRAVEPYRILTFTDRPVYRPNQTVHLKCVVRENGKDGYAVASGTTVRVEIQNPRGEKVFEKSLVTNDQGSIAADLAVAEEPPLGVWTIRTFVGDRQYYSQRWTGAQFRVEEYKKPEFEVTVSAGAARVKPGTPVRAEVEARYYFGTPVANADATWQVFRQAYRHTVPVRRDYRWYYDDLYPAPRGYWGRELVTEGKGLTDAEGKLAIEFVTKDYGDDMDSRFFVEVAVTDSSRREISGSASVAATRQPFFARLEARRGLLKPGDAVELSIRAEDANRTPVASEGKVVLARRVDREEEKDGKKRNVIDWVEVGSVPALTRADGEGIAKVVVDEPGQFRLTYVTKPEGEPEVTGEAFVWVVTKDFPGSQYRFSGVEVVTDTDTYAIGDTMEVLVNSHVEDAWILLTVEAGERVLETRVVKASGKLHVEKFAVGEGWTPNVWVKALTIRDEAVFMDRRQVVVPPVRRFLDVKVAPKVPKADWRPGEEAEFLVTAVDASGEPADAELSLVFFDKSVLYIQPDQTPDLRQFFYGAKRPDGVSLSSSFDFRHRGAEKQKAGHELKRYREIGRPETMNPWFYEFSGFTGDLSGPFEGPGQNDVIGIGGGAGGGFGGRGGMRRGLDTGAPPAPESARAMDKDDEGEGGERLKSEAKGLRKAGAGEAEAGPEAEPVERAFFPDTAFWDPMVRTGANGSATVKVRFPDSLTTWRATARGATAKTSVGSAEADFVVTKKLLVRLQAPRFFRERDEVVVSGIVMNAFDEALPVRVLVAADGGALEMLDRGELSRPEQTITVGAGKEQRIDWWFRVVRPGKVSIRVDARTERESDAVRMGFPVYEHGVEKFTALSGRLADGDGAQTSEMTFFVPEDRHEDASDLTVTVSPTVAHAMLQALPFLADYPYGCVEQTMSRFLPSVVVKKTLLDLGYTLADLGIDPTRQVPDGYWGRPHVQGLKVLRDEDLSRAVAEGVRRLADFQNGDGSWGWFRGAGADLMMTSYVVRGLALAGRAGAQVDREMLQRGANFLYGQLKNTDPKEREEKGMTVSPDLLVAVAGALLDVASLNGEPRDLAVRIADWLYERREKLGAVSRARLAIALVRLGRPEDARIVCENLTDQALVDRENGTARFGRNEGYYGWYDDAVTGTAETLRAYLLAEPGSELIPMMVKWLATNRRGAGWKSTMDSAHAILALCDYLKASGELAPDLTVKITVDDRVTKTVRVTKENLFTLDGTLTLRGADLPAGRHVVRIEREGKGNLYYEGHLTVYTREEHVKGTGAEIRVARAAYRIHEGKRDVERKDWVRDHYETRTVTEVYEEREPLADGATLTVGDVVEVELTLAAKNDYRYLVFSDFKGAGFEALDRTSGHGGGGILTYREFRDERVDLFVSSLPQGEQTVRYRLRAEIPGIFHVMPTTGFAMYLPDVRTISDEMILSITEPGIR